MAKVEGPFQIRQRIQILRVTRKLVAAGELKKGMSNDEIKEVIAAALLDDDPEVYGAPEFDWKALLDLIIKMLPLILALFGL
jgi:hypothetical protein